jgi:hypothetical protein
MIINNLVNMHPTQVAAGRGVLDDLRKGVVKMCEVIDGNKIPDESDIVRVNYFVHTLRVFQAEMLVHLKDWEGLQTVIGVCLSFACSFFPLCFRRS